MHVPVGIRSIAVSFPSIVRTNDYYKENYPDVYKKADKKTLARLMSLAQSNPSNDFELEMFPYLEDPFRGSVERRVLGIGESSLTLEYSAAKDALLSAKLSPNDVDLIIACSVLPENIGAGNAAFIARELGLQCGAWNLDATCGSTPVALQTAAALVQTGVHRNVLVVVSCTFSRLADENDTLSWFWGDGAGAILITPLEVNQGILGTKIVNTGVLCDQFRIKAKASEQGNAKLYMHVAKNANQVTSETATQLLRTCCDGAIEKVGVTLDEIDFFIFNTPNAWFAKFCVRVLGIDPNRTINLYPVYANIGPVLPIANMYHAAQMGKIRSDDLVLMYSFGAAGSAAATVMRWGDVALGSAGLGS